MYAIILVNTPLHLPSRLLIYDNKIIWSMDYAVGFDMYTSADADTKPIKGLAADSGV